ncbi:hypothetical protein PILCRDRAFT_90464 [Piloderma croceum F 1598]|uniref:Uncharacterized protein n=1 Tax=Piloderma croceum (strain F 1598) TaxID=765440 RepID=A0A0C3F2E0_PILCF|nr:hypothetical protein PILCRDRAFT_90464 [Piloderma croceum F 1598]
MAISRGNSPTPQEMKELLKKKDNEIESMRDLLGSWGNMTLLRQRLEETKGQLGWDRIRELEVASKKREKDIDRMKERMREYETILEEIHQESLERLRAFETVITRLDEFIAFPHPDRPEFENKEIRVICSRFASLWETDREQLASRLLGRHCTILLPSHKLGDGCSDHLPLLSD